MKPIKLVLTAFGPYKDTEVIDFTKLEQHLIFVISGNTGAGKTTIFDAVCYALYGTASGEDRAEFRTLRSHFAEENVHTAVELEFSVKDKHYRVFRQMKHRKGNNKSETGDKIELFECLADGKEVPAVDRFVVQDVNQKLVQIIGLTKDQFSQIVMLPQGEFRKLLTSSTDNKEEILRKIFRTEKYEHLEQLVGQKYKQKMEQIKDQLAEQQVLIAQTRELVGEPKSTALQQLFLQPDFNTTQLIEALKAEQQQVSAYILQVTQQKKDVHIKLIELRNKLTETEQLNEKIVKQKQLKEQLLKLNESQTQYEKWKMNLQYAIQAVEVAWVENAMQEAEKRVIQGENHLLEQKQRLLLDQQAVEKAKLQYEQEKLKEAERKQLELTIHQLGQLMPVVQEYNVLDKRVNQDLFIVQQKQDSLKSEQNDMIQIKEQIKQTKAIIELHEQAKVNMLQLSQKKEETLRQGKLTGKLIEQYNQLIAWTNEQKESEAELVILQEDYTRLEQSWINAQAAILASHLHDGAACPVCGSLEHPNRAILTEEAPTKEQLEIAKHKLDKKLQIVLGLQANYISGITQIKAYKDDISNEVIANKLTRLEDDIKGIESDLLQYQQQLRQDWKELQVQYEKLEQSNELFEHAKERLSIEEQQLEAKELFITQLTQTVEAAKLEYAANQIKLNELKSRLPDSITSLDTLEAQNMSSKQKLAQLEKAYQQAEVLLNTLEKQLSAAESAVAASVKTVKELKELYEEAKQKFTSKLAESNFKSVEHYIKSKLQEQEIAVLKQQIEHFEHELLTLNHELQLLEEAIGARTFTDTEQLKRDITEAEQLFEQFLREETTMQQLNDQVITMMSNLDTLASQISAYEHEVSMIHDLFLTIKGDNRLKLSYERYVLIDYLEQIIVMANLRLKHLTGGQFELKRSDRLEANGKQSGLGLDVYDSYTGQNRDVKSLSGGEKFNASLCLALGMTDVIQSSQGGVSIEMMFIDEGFGSLDEESLQKAIATLIDLQKAGRMIGVISHVQELKDALDACLEVSKTRDGHAKAQFVIKR